MLMQALRDMPLLRLAAAFLRIRRLARRLKTRADVERWQEQRIAHWLSQSVAKAGYYRGRSIASLSDLPVIDKSVLMTNFDQFNVAGITSEQGWAMLESGRQPKGYVVGASTGTSGNRGLFVISDAERYEWLGVILGKLLPRFPQDTARIGLVLPLHSALYSSVNRTYRLALKFFDLKRGVAEIAPDIVAWRPDTIIAPPKVLRWLAEHDATLAPKRLFSAAEVLDPIDRAVIERRYRITLGQIYMATEGLFATSCPHGTLHLAEDAVHFELEPVPGSDLVSPIISDFTRETQIMARYRMNDLLRLKPDGCPCGSPLRAVAEIVGRSDDIFELPRRGEGGTVTVTPDVLRNAILDADRSITDFRLVQCGPEMIELLLPETATPEALAAARNAVERLLRAMGARSEIMSGTSQLPPPTVKLRRVERRWRPDRAR
jgi:putative adenylate-forming enzyme